jgi:gamma-glutamylcyclotransferase (GGCT)/AIG2-like uncharacterized protein YtfP
VILTHDYPPYLFAYGTLMRGECRHSLLIPAGILSITTASLPGLLFHLGEYPGLVLSDDQSRLVKGELIEFADLGPILDRLDEEEGSEYDRSLIRVTTADGNTQLAWTYILSEVPQGAPVIESGEWQ